MHKVACGQWHFAEGCHLVTLTKPPFEYWVEATAIFLLPPKKLRVAVKCLRMHRTVEKGGERAANPALGAPRTGPLFLTGALRLALAQGLASAPADLGASPKPATATPRKDHAPVPVVPGPWLCSKFAYTSVIRWKEFHSRAAFQEKRPLQGCDTIRSSALDPGGPNTNIACMKPPASPDSPARLRLRRPLPTGPRASPGKEQCPAIIAAERMVTTSLTDHY